MANRNQDTGRIQEIVIISGKGGTGKTSITAAFATIAGAVIVADCDVDAADLHLILDPEIRRRYEFSGGKQARIDPEGCIACSTCQGYCRFGAVHMKMLDTEGAMRPVFEVDPVACEGCGVCAWFCPESAIALEEVVNGEWFVSDTRVGTMVHARLGIAEENSGKLVSVVRDAARKEAAASGCPLILVDGSPGVGCPVIASITGASLAVAVCEPTCSGLHDLRRVAELARHFAIPLAVVINKWDINAGVTGEILAFCASEGLHMAGRIPYDDAVVEAMIARKSIVEHGGSAAQAIDEIWDRIVELLPAPTQARIRTAHGPG